MTSFAISALPGSMAAGRRGSPGRRARLLPVFLLALLSLLMVPGVSSAQDGAVPAAPAGESGATESTPALEQGGAAEGAPLILPRSQRPYQHVFLAFGIAWLLMLAFVVVLARRFAALERDLARLGPSGR